MNLNNLFSSGRPRVASILTFVIFLCASAQAQLFHGGAILKTPLGPNGTATARVGDTITATITVMNLDDFGDTLTINSLYDTNLHFSGTMVSPNLLPSPV